MAFQPRQPRYKIEWRARVRCRDWSVAQRVATADASQGGLFLTTDHPPHVGARVEVELELPDGRTMVLAGECVHVRTSEQALTEGRPPGFGLRFDHAHVADLLALEEMVRAVGVPLEVVDDDEPRRHVVQEQVPAAAAAELPEPPVLSLRPTDGTGRLGGSRR